MLKGDKRENRTVEEKIGVVSEIINKLKNHIGKSGEIVDLYKSEYSYYDKLKKDFNEYVRSEYSISGKVRFEEIGCNIEYNLPIKRRHEPIFVIKKRN
jgi:hypothetical protein